MATPIAQPRTQARTETIEPDSPSMVSKRNENDGVIPRWFVGSFITLVLAVLGQWGWLIHSNATMSERLSNYNDSVKSQAVIFNAMLERERNDREREQKDFRDQLQLTRLEIQSLTVKLAEKGFRVK